MMLVRYSWPELLRASHCLLRLMLRDPDRDSCAHFLLDAAEARFAAETWIEWAPGRECPLLELVRGALERAAALPQSDAEQPEQTQIQEWLRASFLVLLLHDQRVQCFCMAQHDVHRQLQSRPPERHKANRYMDAVRSLVQAALRRRISLGTLVEMATEEWESGFMYSR